MKIIPLYSAVFLLFVVGGDANPVLIQNDDVTSNCPPGYSQPALASSWNKCYKIYTASKSDKDASAICKQDNGTLASISDAFTNSFIYSQATQVGVTKLWLGVHCFKGDAKECHNDDNSNFGYSNFAPGQPTSQDICIFMLTTGRYSQMWSTLDCEQTVQFACEVIVSPGPAPTTVSPITTTHKTGTCPEGWSPFQGMCYRKYEALVDGLTRDQQSVQCKRTPGGNLATINSAELKEFITDLPCGNGFVRIGLQCPNAPSRGDTSTCVWDDGTPFSYSNFMAGQPNIYPSPNCGYSAFGNWENNYECDQTFECSACQAPMQ